MKAKRGRPPKGTAIVEEKTGLPKLKTKFGLPASGVADLKSTIFPIELAPHDPNGVSAMPSVVDRGALARPSDVDPERLIATAIQTGNIDTLERILAMRDRLKAERAREAYFDALSAFQAECPEIVKRQAVKSKNGSLRYRFAPLPVILAATKEPLRKNGFSWTTETKQDKDNVTAIVTLHHREGHNESTSFMVPVDHQAVADRYMNAPQAVASALTYAKRYAFCDATGIMTADGDDDANSVQDSEPEQVNETIVGDVPPAYWNAPRGGEKQQLILVGAYGPAKRYEVRKIPDQAAPKGHVWKVVKIENANMEGQLKEAVAQAEQTTPKGQGTLTEGVVAHITKEILIDLLDSNLSAGYLTGDQVSAAKKEWNEAPVTWEARATLFEKYKKLGEAKMLEKI